MLNGMAVYIIMSSFIMLNVIVLSINMSSFIIQSAVMLGALFWMPQTQCRNDEWHLTKCSGTVILSNDWFPWLCTRSALHLKQKKTCLVTSLSFLSVWLLPFRERARPVQLQWTKKPFGIVSTWWSAEKTLQCFSYIFYHKNYFVFSCWKKRYFFCLWKELLESVKDESFFSKITKYRVGDATLGVTTFSLTTLSKHNDIPHTNKWNETLGIMALD